ncbi:MAG: hypothetical protein AAFW75_18740 [Cyanobacteria bacterium J06636_16]
MNQQEDLVKSIAYALKRAGFKKIFLSDSTLTVKLPMFCSVSAKIGIGYLEQSCKFGNIQREYAVLITILVVLVIIGLLGRNLIFFGFALLPLVWDVIRWQMTSRVMKKIEALHSTECDT